MQGIFYSAARDAINNRVKLRDNVLIFYLAAIATIYGAAFGTKENTDLLLMVPFVALGASFMLTQHHTTIGSIVNYLAFEFKLPSKSEDFRDNLHWDISESVTGNNKRSMFLVICSHLALIVLPAFAALFYKAFENGKFSLSGLSFIVFVLGILALIFCCFLIFSAHRYRAKINDKINEMIHKTTRDVDS